LLVPNVTYLRLNVFIKSILLSKQTHPGCLAIAANISQEGNLRTQYCKLSHRYCGFSVTPLSRGGPPQRSLKSLGEAGCVTRGYAVRLDKMLKLVLFLPVPYIHPVKLGLLVYFAYPLYSLSNIKASK
jgi:hypothetical protein